MRHILLAVLLLLATPAMAEDMLRVGTWKTAQTIQPYFYEQFLSGRQVEVHPFTNPGDQKAALLAGSLDMTGTTLALAISAASRGEPVTVVATLCAKCSALVVGKQSGVTQIADLRGKRIGYVPGTMHEILLREALTRAGLDPTGDVTLIRIDFFDMGTALARGDIDAFLSGEPLPTKAVRDGYGSILAYPYFDDSIGPINAAMIVRTDRLEKDRETIKALVAAHVQATKRLRSDPQQWLSEAATRFGADRAMLDAAAGNMELTWDMDETFVRQVAALGARMKALGIIEKEPDYARLIDPSLVAELRDH